MKTGQKLLLFAVVMIAPAILPAASKDEGPKRCGTVHQKPIAVFIEPSDKEIESMKRGGEEAFYTIADDAMYYQAQALEYLEKMRYPYCFTKEEKHVFKTDDNRQYAVNQKCGAWCLILWDGKGEPVFTYTADISSHEAYLKGANLK